MGVRTALGDVIFSQVIGTKTPMTQTRQVSGTTTRSYGGPAVNPFGIAEAPT